MKRSSVSQEHSVVAFFNQNSGISSLTLTDIGDVLSDTDLPQTPHRVACQYHSPWVGGNVELFLQNNGLFFNELVYFTRLEAGSIPLLGIVLGKDPKPDLTDRHQR